MSRIEKGGPRFRPGAPGPIQRRQQGNPLRPSQPIPPPTSAFSSTTNDASNRSQAGDDPSSEASERNTAPLAPMRPPSIGPSRPPSTTKSFAIVNRKPPRPITIGVSTGDADAGSASGSRPAPPASLSRAALPTPPTRPITPAPDSLRSGSVPPPAAAVASRRSATPSTRPSASPAPERRRRDSTASAAGPSGTTPAPWEQPPSAPEDSVGLKRAAPSDMGPPLLAAKRQKAAMTPGEPSSEVPASAAPSEQNAPSNTASEPATTQPETAMEPTGGSDETTATIRRKPRATAAEKKKQVGGNENAEAGPSRPARHAKVAAAIRAPNDSDADEDDQEAQRPDSSEDDSASDEYTPKRKGSLYARGGRRSVSSGKKRAAPTTDATESDSDSDSELEDDADEVDEASPNGTRKGKGKGEDGSTATKKRTYRTVRLPAAAPRRPSTSYLLFANQKRQQLHAENPELSFRELGTRTGEAWRALGEEERAVFEETSKGLREQWKKDVEEWKAQNPGWEAQAQAEAAAPKKSRGRPKTGKPAKTGKIYREGEPRRPQTAYMLFCARMREDRAAARAEAASQGSETPKSKETEFMKEAGEAWRNLGEEAKRPFLDEAKKLRDEYDVAIEAWEDEHPSAFEDSDEEGASTDAGSAKGGRGRGTSCSRSRSRRRSRRSKAEGTSVGRKRTKRVSDDEAEYLAQIVEHGEELKTQKLNARTTSMADLSVAELAAGRAGPRTFHLRRVYRELQDKRRAELKRIKIEGQAAALNPSQAATAAAAASASASGNQAGTSKNKSSTSASQPSARTGPRAPVNDEDEEEIVGEVEGFLNDAGPSRRGRPSRHNDDDDGEEEGEGDDRASGQGSDDDAESVGGQSVASTHVSFRENRFAVRVRQVNGQIVLDESSLHANLGEGAEDEGQEFVEENDREKFITSATRGKRKGTERWDSEETDKFLKAVSMWGTDFEIIARLFPRRDRKQIKAKWRTEERSNADRLHAAFNKPQKADLEEYGAVVGVDLSGPPPVITAKKPPMGDDEEEGGSGTLFGAKMESMEQTMGGIRKASQTPQPNSEGGAGRASSSRAPSASAASASGMEEGDEDDDDDLMATLSIDEIIARKKAQFRKSQSQAQGSGAGAGAGAGRKRSNSAASSRGKGKARDSGSGRGSAASGGNRSTNRRRAEEDNVEIVGNID